MRLRPELGGQGWRQVSLLPCIWSPPASPPPGLMGCLASVMSLLEFLLGQDHKGRTDGAGGTPLAASLAPLLPYFHPNTVPFCAGSIPSSMQPCASEAAQLPDEPKWSKGHPVPSPGLGSGPVLTDGTTTEGLLLKEPLPLRQSCLLLWTLLCQDGVPAPAAAAGAPA